ncbi:actin cytoskeleton-regulatory complex protein pan1-like [Anneissia japonica]|uniref:actin cytoskeleton-regulatory complex protein pan1-like n=1 Tax=Anneissia japonica TaxID=1529436 RepID=UPI0014256AD1|nr:actin cytoskeleton-regulatory complex protein pan1-like [Anneissia japonica]
MSINMFTWASANISEGYSDHDSIYGCIDWSCKTKITPTTYMSYYTFYPYPYYTEYPNNCYNCMPGCCENGYTYIEKNTTNKVLVDSLTVGFGVLETLICVVTIGLSLSQLSCYLCCRGLNCNCCQPKTIDQYQMVMTPNGNVMLLAVPKAHGVPTMVNNQQNQPVMVQHQPVMILNQHIAAQNQLVGTQSPPNFATGELAGTGEQVHGALQPVTVQAQGQPMLAQSPGQLMMVGGQGPPMLLQAQRQPMMVHQGQGQPMTIQAQGQPMMVHQGQGQPMFQQPMFVQGMGQVGMVPGQGQPTNQTVMIPGQGQTLHTVTQAQIPRPEQQIQATGEPADTGEAMAMVAGQDSGSILNPTV